MTLTYLNDSLCDQRDMLLLRSLTYIDSTTNRRGESREACMRIEGRNRRQFYIDWFLRWIDQNSICPPNGQQIQSCLSATMCTRLLAIPGRLSLDDRTQWRHSTTVARLDKTPLNKKSLFSYESSSQCARSPDNVRVEVLQAVANGG